MHIGTHIDRGDPREYLNITILDNLEMSLILVCIVD